ncbi:MAG: hypothetical protein U9Q21_00175 [Candidatus Auribacterota bacterium]|nr:hypothetical protein [Candidatus Auribacterota bacterium]
MTKQKILLTDTAVDDKCSILRPPLGFWFFVELIIPEGGLFLNCAKVSLRYPFECVYMVDADSHAKTVFDWDDDQPYLYLKLPHAGYSFTRALWIDHDIIFYSSGGNMNYDQEVVITLDNWDTVKKPVIGT